MKTGQGELACYCGVGVSGLKSRNTKLFSFEIKIEALGPFDIIQRTDIPSGEKIPPTPVKIGRIVGKSVLWNNLPF